MIMVLVDIKKMGIFTHLFKSSILFQLKVQKFRVSGLRASTKIIINFVVLENVLKLKLSKRKPSKKH